MRYNRRMLPDLEIEDVIRLKRAHPCGSTTWKVTRLGADIRLECCQCGRKVILSRRELSHKIKTVVIKETNAKENR